MAVANAKDLEPVASRIEPELRRRLAEKRAVADRSEAAEIRQAIKAWVRSDPAATTSTKEKVA